ncbi:hypothetical protein FOZ63_004679 [Perkinsus olseni]|uniref:Regulatory protein zeste n=1 Tax=Perkinsus olseni TaxID=32597 RepID=A0A7J6RV17_PEROL|nr:hypothetical protein FOZ63_004679 [Perkinsus olseni]KAF4735374.1 hypothetical protein FOZ62_020981 [Perkinsus olseni]
MVASRRTKEQVSEDRKRVMEEKLSFLALIEQNIKHLEGQFDNAHTRETRLDKWRGIAAIVIANGWRSLWGRLTDNDIALAKSGNIPATNKLVAYSKWGDLKKRYKVKKDKNAQTGSGGGSSCTLDEMDIVVERILGTGSKASVDGLEVLSDGVPDIIGQEEVLHPLVENSVQQSCRSAGDGGDVPITGLSDSSRSSPSSSTLTGQPHASTATTSSRVDKPSKRQRVATDGRSLAEAAVSLKASQENYVKQKTELLACSYIVYFV